MYESCFKFVKVHNKLMAFNIWIICCVCVWSLSDVMFVVKCATQAVCVVIRWRICQSECRSPVSASRGRCRTASPRPHPVAARRPVINKAASARVQSDLWKHYQHYCLQRKATFWNTRSCYFFLSILKHYGYRLKDPHSRRKDGRERLGHRDGLEEEGADCCPGQVQAG